MPATREYAHLTPDELAAFNDYDDRVGEAEYRAYFGGGPWPGRTAAEAQAAAVEAGAEEVPF